MKLQDLYDKPIDRPVNPAVSVTKFDDKTEETEIQEYVFTDEIFNGLFRILDAVKNNRSYNHVGIWIDGYYGSGKSHFLKYLDYCITPRTREKAMGRLLEAVKAVDPLDEKHCLEFDYEQMRSIANWLKRATVDTCIFNLETSYDNSTDKKKAFLHVFWNEFNGKRGFNKFHVTLAQNLEKPLAEKGVFEKFKARIAEEGGDWNDPGNAADLVDNELDRVLEIAKDVAPTLAVDSIRERIIRRDTNMSIDRFAAELAGYLKDKGDDYRLVFLADEVSQFINKERDRYLNLQEIITRLSEACRNKVWVACTAQQELAEIMDDCDIPDEKDKEGKIKGRFEVKVSLKGTQPEVIVQKRILDKKEEVKAGLEAFYDKQKAAFDLQFRLPNSYGGYASKEDFVACYPFVPYQFKLIMQVFNSFLNLGYVAKEVKGNERSIIKVIHATARKNAEEEVGKFISFDELYNSMFEEGLQARGQKAVDNAIRMAGTYGRDRKMAVRVTNVLFMICNISATDKLVFPATVDNVTSLLVNNMETSRLTVKNEVGRIVDFLCENNVIRREQGRQGAPDTFAFYSEEEMNIAQLIKSQVPDNNRQAEQLRNIFCAYIPALKNKEQYKTRSFSVGLSIKQRSFLHANNPDVLVEFAVDNDYETAELLALQNTGNRMVYYVGPQLRENKRLYNAFYWYCQATLYMETSAAKNGDSKMSEEFSKRAEELKKHTIVPEMQKILDTCPIVSGLNVIDEAELGKKKGNDRYRAAITRHLAGIYTKAGLVNRGDMPDNTEQLKKAILRPVSPEEYGGLNASLPDAEHEVEIYLDKQCGEVNVADVLAKFAKAPYGWNDLCTLHVVNELVRRRNRDYSYANNPNVEASVVANRIVTEQGKFTLRKAKAISPQVIGDFIAAWKDIFGISAAPGTGDGTQLFRLCRGRENEHSLPRLVDGYKDMERQIDGYPFAQPFRDAIGLFGKWLDERDPVKFFNAVTEDRREARDLVDRCRELEQFIHDQLPAYVSLRRFVDDNQYNFEFVPEDMRADVGEIRKIREDAWPVEGFRDYLMLRRRLSGALDEVREKMRGEIRTVYDKLFDNLLRTAEGQDVPASVLADREETIRHKTSPDDLSVLRNNIDTNDFYEKQIDRIMSYTPPAAPRPGDGRQPPSPPRKKIRQASLDTRTLQPLCSEEDVDRYLEDLRRKLLELLAGHDGLMITK